MESRQNAQPRRYPLQVTIAFVFSSLFLLVGLTLILYNYRETRRMALQEADRFLASAAGRIETEVSNIYRPIRSLVDVSSQILSATGHSLGEPEPLVRYMTESLRRIPSLSSVFLGYENGDFLLVRRYDSQLPIDAESDTPEGVSYVVQTVDRDAGGLGEERWVYLNDELEPLGRRQLQGAGFDPRQREWYTSAIDTVEVVHSSFYVFFTTRQIGLTVARRLADGGAVVGADLALTDLEQALAAAKVTASTRVAVVESEGSVIALSDPEGEVLGRPADPRSAVEMPQLSFVRDAVYRRLGERLDAAASTGRELEEIEGRSWAVSVTRIARIPDSEVFLAVAVPLDELLAGARRLQIDSASISVVFLILAVLLVVGVSRNLSRSLGALADEAERIREFRFDEPSRVDSRIREVDDLSRTMQLMKATISRFLEISMALSAEKDYRRVLEMVLAEAREATGADAGAVLMVSEDRTMLDVALLTDSGSGVAFADDHPEDERFASTALGELEHGTSGQSIDHASAVEARIVNLAELAAASGFETAGLRRRLERAEFVIGSVLSVPLRNQAEEVIGVLQLARAPGVEGTAAGFPPERVSYVEALASDAAVALDVRRLLKAQRDLLDSLILVIAGAIDAKSPYTSGHCQRVPVIAGLLAQAADTAAGTFSDFSLSEEERYQLHLASWLHDCGKVTTPEYVVDKATRLETIYNRIHEIRMRFEVLWRDAEIDYLKLRSAGEEPEAVLQERLERRHRQIREDFEFVAESNLGETFTTPERVERLRRIAATTWVRKLDDRLGLSHGELEMRSSEPPALPVTEPLLADRPEHVVPRPPGQSPFGSEPHEFRMEVPAHQYNRGELYNLGIARGTLTAEERFKINEHAIQTIRMLGRLPFPRELGNVPDWAGNHHEKLDGSGYPRRLTADELSTPERIMALADVFEALTASDRPYHPPKRLSQALAIMSSMCAEGHLCPELFGLFLESEVYLRYGREYLRPDQVDDVDVDALIARAGG